REAQHGGSGHLEARERLTLAADELRLARHRRVHAGDDVAVLAGALEIEVDEGAGALAHGAPLVGPDHGAARLHPRRVVHAAAARERAAQCGDGERRRRHARNAPPAATAYTAGPWPSRVRTSSPGARR